MYAPFVQFCLYLLYTVLECTLYSVVSKMATGYIAGGENAPLIDLGWDAPSGQMYSTINDLLKVVLTFIFIITSCCTIIPCTVCVAVRFFQLGVYSHWIC